MSGIKRWIDATTNEEAKQWLTAFGKKLRKDVEKDERWTDRVKANKDNPKKQLSICIDHLPIPAAFKSGMVALRAIINEKIKAKKDIKDDVQLLYRIAAIDSFRIDTIKRYQIPVYGVEDAVPGAILWNADLDYRRLGFTQLPLVNKTDAKWIVEVFGEPVSHSTLNVIMRYLWDQYELQRLNERESFPSRVEVRINI